MEAGQAVPIDLRRWGHLEDAKHVETPEGENHALNHSGLPGI
jgi:hypothetical protein